MRHIKYFLLVLILISTGCKEKIYTEKPDDIYFSMQENIEVYSDISFEELLLETNADIISDNFEMDTTEVGNKTYKIYYRYNKKKYEYEFNITVVDSKGPVIFGSTSRTVIKNNPIDLCELISFGDNYDRNLTCEIVGDYNFTQVNKYNLVMNVTDNSNNKTSKNVVLNVIEKKENNPTEPVEPDYFSDIVKNYKDINTEFGIDVSRWQESVDFEKVKQAGASFVIMRIGVQKGIDGEIAIDNYFLENIENAKKYGLKVGVYLYSNAKSVDEAEEQALWVIKELGDYKLELPIVFDWEDWQNWNAYKINFNDINLIANTFIDTINDNGYAGMLYGSKYYLENMWQVDHPIWLAHYTSKTNYSGNYALWQLTNNGRIDGIDGAVDINILYNDKILLN